MVFIVGGSDGPFGGFLLLDRVQGFGLRALGGGQVFMKDNVLLHMLQRSRIIITNKQIIEITFPQAAGYQQQGILPNVNHKRYNLIKKIKHVTGASMHDFQVCPQHRTGEVLGKIRLK